jgi:hypothetical protein
MALTQAQAARLRAHPHVADVESEALDDGRFFVHLKPGCDFRTDPRQPIRTKSFGSYAEARTALARATAERAQSPKE